MQRFLDPTVLASISGLELIAKTVVDGFVSGLHRSPDFGFSQEFAEYRAYTEGDDLRHVDWNVFARTDRMYLKRYRGETNTQLTLLLDASASMAYGSHNVNKLDFARYLIASIAYLSHQQRDASGIIVFDDEIRNFVPPSSRQGQFPRILHAIEKAEPGRRTDFAKPFFHCQSFLHRRGVIVVVSDFYEDAEVVVKTMEPMRFHGNEIILFHVLDPQEIRPVIKDPALVLDMETGDTIEVTPDYVKHEYGPKIDGHIAALRDRAQRSGIDYFLLDTSKPLDAALRSYLLVRQGRQ
ncbi:MAG TPA: DUF58 domain-containing protein [Bryobacteraceae bacterium]|nr:DUF58 domain-containing protein [Bryobacteraceae bacterium]